MAFLSTNRNLLLLKTPDPLPIRDIKGWTNLMLKQKLFKASKLYPLNTGNKLYNRAPAQLVALKLKMY